MSSTSFPLLVDGDGRIINYTMYNLSKKKIEIKKKLYEVKQQQKHPDEDKRYWKERKVNDGCENCYPCVVSRDKTCGVNI